MARVLNPMELKMIKDALELVDKNKTFFEQWAINEFQGKTEGWNVGYFCDIAKEVKAGNFEDVYDEMMSMGVPTKQFVSLCVEYLNNGDDFLQYVINRNAELEASATEVKIIDNAPAGVFKTMWGYRIQNQNVYAVVHGQKIYSLTDDEDAVWHKLLGMTKAEYEDAVRKELEKEEAEKLQSELDYLDKMEERIEKGKKVLPPSRWAAWEKELKNILDSGHAAIEDPVDTMLEFFEAWKNKESDEKLDSILFQLERPESVFFNLKQVMGDEVSNYINEFKERLFGIENE